MSEEAHLQRRAFVTCSARAVSPVRLLMEEVEQRLLDAGWRTRVPNRFESHPIASLEERRRLAAGTRDDVARARVLLHVASPANVQGTSLHRELAQAIRLQLPVILVVAASDRERLGVGMPRPDRIDKLVAQTSGHVLSRMDDLVGLVERVARQ